MITNYYAAIFCKIANNESPCFKLWENDEFMAFLDIMPNVKWQTLLIPKKHYDSDLFLINDEKFYWKLMMAAKEVIDMLKKSLMDKSPRLRICAIEALSNSEFDCSYELIHERHLNDDDIEVKKNALVALYNISDRKILDEVINDDFDFELKKYAKEIIDEF